MDRKTLTRRTFTKVAALTGIACGMSASLAPGVALAQDETAAQAGGSTTRVRSCCRGCGKMECGVWVIVKDGRAIRVEGDETDAGSRGNCCTKSQASIQAAYHPDRLRYPMKRTNPKGEDPGWERITWDEALKTTADNLLGIAKKYSGNSVFCLYGTSRVYAMAAQAVTQMVFNSPNNHAAYEICKGPRHFASCLVDDFGSPWMETCMDPRVYVQWGTGPEYSNYDDSCRTVVDVAQRADCHILVDPRQGALGKEADYHLALRPGTDAFIAMAWLNIVIERELYDDLIVKRWTNAPFLYCADNDPSGGFYPDLKGGIECDTRLLKENDLKEGGSYTRFMVYDNNYAQLASQGIVHEFGPLTWFDSSTCLWEHETEVRYPKTGQYIDPPVHTAFKAKGWLPDPSPFDPAIDPAIYSNGGFDVTLKSGKSLKFTTIWDMFAERCAAYDLNTASEVTGCPADLIEETCLIWATRKNPSYGNGGLHFQLAVDQTGNSIHTSRALMILSHITDNYDTPAGNRGCTLAKVNATPGGPVQPRQFDVVRPQSAETCNFRKNAALIGGDRFPLTRYFGFWSDANALWDAIHTGDPYPPKGALAITGNFMNQSNCTYGWEAMKTLDFFVMDDLWNVPMADLADILLPSTHWIETDSPRVSQGASGMIGATVACIDPPGEAQTDYDTVSQLIFSMGMPSNVTPGKEMTMASHDDILNGCVDCFDPAPTWDVYKEKFQKDGWWEAKAVYPERWGTYRRYEMGQARQQANFYMGPSDGKQGFNMPCGKTEIWSLAIEAYGTQGTYGGYQVTMKDCLPVAIEPVKSKRQAPQYYTEDNSFYMTTGRRIPVYFHSEHRQLPWCRELWPVPRLEINPEDAARLDIKQGDWLWIENENGKIREIADLYYGIDVGVVNAEHTWWYPEVGDCGRGWELSAVNQLVWRNDQDPICGSSTLRGYPVKIYKATADNSPFGDPVPCDANGVEIIHSCNDPRLKEWLPDYEGRE